jgi:hypothetical protein
MLEPSENSPRRIGMAIFLGLLFVGIAAIAPYLFDLVVPTAPDVPTQSLKDEIGAEPTPAQRIPAQVALEEIRKRDLELAGSYGWVDPEQGVVRVPIARAKEHVLSQGLPSR